MQDKGEGNSAIILNADGDAAGRCAISQVLQKAGFRVREASSAAETLVLAAEEPGLILLEVALPDANGLDVCRQLKANPQTAAIPVLLFSSHCGSMSQRVNGLEAGADGCLARTTDTDELVATIRALLRSRRLQQAAVERRLDLAELSQTKAQLREQAEEIAKLMDVLPVGVFITHDAECRRIIGNRIGYEMLRMPLGSNLSVTAPPGEKPPWTVRCNGKAVSPEELPVQQAARGIEVRDAEVEHIFEDGTTYSFYGSASPLFDAEGRSRGSVAVFMDITQQKNLEAELQQRIAQLAEADRRKDEFLAMLAHELRNPLAPIRNAIQIIKLLSSADPNLERSREIIERQVKHLARLVDDLLDVSRITRGKIKLHKQPVELAAVIARAVETSHSLLEARRHQLTVTLPPDPVQVEADATRLAQVLSNLLDNAAKYTDEGGHVWLTVEVQGDKAAVRLRDTGMGIAADLLPRVFDLFTQGDRSLARSEGGLGIGLTVARSLVEMHGGTVEVHSAGTGRGSEFIVWLPVLAARPAPAPGARAEVSPRPAPATRRVLIVDDNEDAAESMALLLREDGHQVATAYDGPTALRVAEAFRPEAVFLDIGLPRMDGFEVARCLREQLGLTDTLLVALTGYGQEEDRRRGREVGFDVHLVKPADPTDLQKLLARGA